MNKWLVLLLAGLMLSLSVVLEVQAKDDSSKDLSVKLMNSLTVTEKNWLEEHPVIRVGGPKAFPPFHYYDVHGRATGVGPDYAILIMKMLGVQILYEPATPWPKVLEKMKTDRLDVIACAAKSPEREAFMDFSNPYLSFPLVIITRRDGSPITDLADLHGRKVALIKGISTSEWLHDQGIDVIPDPVDSPLEALKAVSAGQAEATIENLAAASYLIQENGLFNLKVAAPTTWGNYELFFAVRKDWPVLVSIINKALDVIPAEQKTAMTNTWITVHYEFGIAGKKIALWAVVILVPILTFSGFIFFYNRRLKAEIRARQSAELEREQVIAKLQSALANVKQLKGLLPICASCKKIRDDQGYWQQVEEYVKEHSDAEFSHGLCPDCIRELYPEVAETVLTKVGVKR